MATERGVDDDAGLAAVHAGLADVRLVAPVGPVEVALGRIEGDGARLLQAFVQQDLAVAAVQFRHLDRVRLLVAPVQVAADPVDGQAVRILQRRRVQRLRLIANKKNSVKLGKRRFRNSDSRLGRVTCGSAWVQHGSTSMKAVMVWIVHRVG